MTARLVVAGVVVLERARSTLREHWRRLLVGAFVGWALASVLGAAAIVGVELELGRGVSDTVAIVLVYGGIAAGMLVAYALRAERG